MCLYCGCKYLTGGDEARISNCIKHNSLGCSYWSISQTQEYTWGCVYMRSMSVVCRNDSDSKVHGAHLGLTGPRWAPCWPHELCYLGSCVGVQLTVFCWAVKWFSGNFHIFKKEPLLIHYSECKLWVQCTNQNRKFSLKRIYSFV